MAKKTLPLISIGVYQMARFVVLTISLVIMLRISSQPSFSGVALALGGAAILPALLIVQFVLTRAPAILAPLRVALVLQLVGTSVTLVQVVGDSSALLGPSVLLVASTGILVLFDAGCLLFLLSFTPYSKPRDSTMPSHEGSVARQITVEEVEDT